MDETLYDIIIVGAGPAGLSAAIYCARAKYNVLCLEQEVPGGQVTRTYEVANYPGFDVPLSGAELAEKFYNHAISLGCKVRTDSVIKLVLEDDIKILMTKKGELYKAKTVIICTGAAPRRLNLPGELEFKGKGVSYCGTCDGALFEGKRVAVVGGGNTAIEEALFLARYASEVVIIVRKPIGGLVCNDHLCKQAHHEPKIEFLWQCVVKEIHGTDHVTGLTIHSLAADKDVYLETDGLFIFAGAVPATEVFGDQLEYDDKGYIKVDANKRTNIPGIFAAGDATVTPLRQIITAASDGAIAAISAQKYLNELKKNETPQA